MPRLASPRSSQYFSAISATWAGLVAASFAACTAPAGTDEGQGGAGGATVATTVSGTGGATTSTSSSTASATIVINEIHYDPKASPDDFGEWVELFNASTESVDLGGFVLKDAGSNEHTIQGSHVVGPGEFFVLGRTDDMKANGGVMLDYAYGDDFLLANGGDSVVLVSPDATLVDTVSYGATAPWPEALAGTSIELDVPSSDNADPAHWQHAVLTFGAGDRGTPGKPNGGMLGGFTVDATVAPWQDPALSASLFFAPLDPLETLVLTTIGAAKKSLRLAYFNVRIPAVKKLLEEKVKAGLDVHVVLDKKQQDLDYNTMYEELQMVGVPVTLVDNTSATDATMHDKFTVIDGEVVLTGSANYSETALNVSDEDLVILRSKELAARYTTEFDELVAKGSTKSTPYAANAVVKAWMGPEDALSYKLKSALDAAKSSIVVAMFQLNADNLVDALVAAQKRGVTVVVVLDEVQAAAPGETADDTLQAAGIAVVKAHNQGGMYSEMHSKFAVIDHELVLMGSVNWTNLGVFFNDENLVLLASPVLAARAEGKFADLLTAYSSVPPATFGLTTGKQSVELTVKNLTLDPGVGVRITGEPGGPFDPPIALDATTVTVQLEAGTRLAYGYEIVQGSTVLATESVEHSFTVPYAPGPFAVADVFVP